MPSVLFMVGSEQHFMEFNYSPVELAKSKLRIGIQENTEVTASGNWGMKTMDRKDQRVNHVLDLTVHSCSSS